MKPTLLPRISYAYFLIGLIAFLIGLLFKFFLVSTKDYDQYTSEVRENIRKELQIAQQDLERLETQVNEKFDSLSYKVLIEQDNKYPLYLFQNTDLMFWSDNNYLVSYDQLERRYQEYTIETPKGIFLVKQQLLVTKNQNLTAIALIPIYSEDKIHNDYLENGSNPDIFPLRTTRPVVRPNDLSDNQTQRIYGVNSNLLFGISFPSDYIWQAKQQYVVLFFMSIGLICLILQVRLIIHFFVDKGDIWLALAVLIITLAFIRVLMILLNVPNGLIDTALFDSRYYASSIFAPSLGDLLLNVIAILIVSCFVFVHFSQLSHLRSLGGQGRRKIGAALAIVASYFVLFYHYFNVRNLYLHSPELSLDFTRELDFSVLKLTTLLIAVLTAITYFLLIHVLVRFVEWLRLSEKRLILLVSQGVVLGVFSYLIYVFASNNISWTSLWVVLAHTIYILLVVFEKLPRSERSFTYQIFIYLFLGAIITSFISAYNIYCLELSKESKAKERFAANILSENDLLSEFLLNDVIESLPYDPLIKNRLLTSFTKKDIITRKIKRFYLGYAFDKYDVNVLIFNGNGRPYDNTLTYEEMQAKYARSKYETEYENIFFVHDLSSNTKRYYAFSEVSQSGVMIGKIILELELKKNVSNSVYPNLRSAKPYANDTRAKQWSYAIFSNDELTYTQGNFTYSIDFLKNFEEDKTFTTDSYRHLLIRKSKEKQVVVSSYKYSLKSILANFSLHFICIVLALLSLLAIYRFYFRQQPFKFNLTTRIQLYLNLAFFLPTILLSILIVSILNSENRNQTIQNYFQKAENVAQNFSSQITNFVIYNDIDKSDFTNELQEIAMLTQTEINVFDKSGKLIATSQPNIYDNGLVSSLINPEALAMLIEEGRSKVILAETIGKLNYNSAYVVVRSPDTNEIVGIVDVPFFESQKYADEQILEVVSTMLNVFTGIFLILVIFSFFASRDLTQPLNLVTSRLKKISLKGDNKPLDYESDDEIGLLVSEYNKMLVKLEESRSALAASEKESAWREMAKQVAHEIKNPLTPMKLTLQHLQRVLADEESPAERSIKSLLNQVNTLSDIATSFSAFAKMPIPKTERFDVSLVLQETLILYKNNGSVTLDAILDQGEFFVQGDAKLMGRIFTNLILNGIQAVSPDKEPHINVVLTKQGEENILIYIRDNGKGIDEEVAKKLFIPNFTTKSTGSGIGLSVAKRGIEHAGGKIWFETEPYFGTTFFVELPLA